MGYVPDVNNGDVRTEGMSYVMMLAVQLDDRTVFDYSWWKADPWQVEQSNRVLRFLASQGPDCPSLFHLNGTQATGDVNSAGLLAMAATAALAADRQVGEPFVRRLWELPLPTGQLRYYDGLLTMIALLEVGGQFRCYGPTHRTELQPVQ